MHAAVEAWVSKPHQRVRYHSQLGGDEVGSIPSKISQCAVLQAPKPLLGQSPPQLRCGCAKQCVHCRLQTHIT